jgi:ribosomal protein S18 acetylase RimI-like enzyme
VSASVGAPPVILAGEDGWVEIREPGSYQEFSAIFEIRRLVFGEELGMVEAGVSDVDDSRSVHAYAAFHQGAAAPARPVATGRLTPGAGPNGAALITWVATLPAFRRRGIGEAVMRFLLDAADRAGAEVVVLSAQARAMAFYRRLGFVPYGQSSIVRGITHQPMARMRTRPSDEIAPSSRR